MEICSRFSNNIKTYFSNTIQDEGVYVCKNCGKKVYIENKKRLPTCPKCGSQIFTKD